MSQKVRWATLSDKGWDLHLNHALTSPQASAVLHRCAGEQMLASQEANGIDFLVSVVLEQLASRLLVNHNL